MKYTIIHIDTRKVLKKDIEWIEVLSFFKEKVFEEVSSPHHLDIKEIVWVDTVRK